ncbi:MAG: cytochrome c1 [Rickettsiales bacterium]|nr:cytochrome c1 [Rickettsiales bacterium]|tara:strand:- start:13857 stop:14630 length:774 start_codon:yes stop_codon:yes gene_type:complete
MIKFVILFLTLLTVLHLNAGEQAKEPPKHNWSFNGMLGTFDRAAAQRGYQVYRQVCASCHGLKHVRYQYLQKIGFSKAQVKAIAAEYQVRDGPDDEGEMYDRPGKPSDTFVGPYKNKKAAQAANNGSYPPDLSLITKARAGGADYLYALLTGYQELPPANVDLVPGKYYNPYFPGGQIAMAPPLLEGVVTYDDGTVATPKQMAHDVTTFLAWASEPELEQRRRLGIQWLIFLSIFTIVCYLLKRSYWKIIKKKSSNS